MGQLPALILAPGNQRRATKEDAREWGVKLKDDMPRRSGSEGEDWSESSSEDETWTLAAELLKASKNLKETRGDLDEKMDENKEKRLKRRVKGPEFEFAKLLHTRRQSIQPGSDLSDLSDLSDSEIKAAMEKQLARLIVMLGA